MLIFSVICLLLSNAINNNKNISILYSRVSLIILLYLLLVLYNNFDFRDEACTTFGGLLYIDNLILTINIFIIIIISFIIIITSFIYTKLIVKYKSLNEFNIIEYSLIILFILIGVLLLMSSYDIVTIFLCIELQSYGLYLICSIYRDSEQSVSAGLTYFLLGSLASCIILLGQSLLYANLGTIQLDSLFIIFSISDMIENSLGSHWFYIQISLLIMSIGFLFKISSAPFHFWSPDVYDAIPTVVTTFVAIVPKISILILLLNIVKYTTNNVSYISWSYSLIISSMLSFIIGSLLGLIQHRIKRLYAYSTISHLGFILLALSINNLESIQAFVFYLIQYSITNLNAFIIIIIIGYSILVITKNNSNTLKVHNNSPLQLISQLKGYYAINPLLSISLIITLFSFVGVPPLLGFFAKQKVLSVALNNGYIFMSFVGIITSVISAVYYLIVIKNIFSVDTLYNYKITKDYMSDYLAFIVSMLTILITLFILFEYDVLKLIYIITV